MISCEIVVTGKVQGVGFRRFVYNLAKQLDISGYVKNRYTGDVFIIATGEMDNIEFFIQKLKVGSTFSRVDKVNSFSIPLENEQEGFSIK